MMTIADIKQGYREGRFTPRQLIDRIIENSKKYSEWNIWITPPDKMDIDRYLKELGNMDFDRKPLWGIPFAVKDNIDVDGVKTTAGCPAYGYVPKRSYGAVERLTEAGAIPVGKTNLDQIATGLVGTRSPYGEAHNSLRPELISGGSSSGSAVSVALGLACFALGTDTAGSGRVPAALNHLIGLKPSCGSWPLRGVVPACASLDCVTVLANSAEDAEAVNQIVAGYDPEDRWSKYFSEQEGIPAKDMKVYLPEEEPEFYGPFQSQYKAAWRRTISRIQEKGVHTETADCSFYQKAALLLYGGPCVAERWSDLGKFVTEHPDEIFPVTEKVLETGHRDDYTASYLYSTLHQLAEYKRMSDNLLKDGVLIFPTCAGTYSRDEVRRNPIDTNSDMGKYTNHCNLLDMCAIAIPGEDADEKLPFGITIFAPAGRDREILSFAKYLLKK